MKALISFIIIALLIISSIVGVYYFIERPVVSKVVNINLTVSMLDEDDSFLKTGYKIYVNGDFLRDGKSITKGPILERVPIDKIITIHNYNLEDQNYIISKSNINTSNVVGFLRYQSKLEELGNVSINFAGNLGKDTRVYLKKDGVIDDIILCYRWSGAILYIKKPDVFTEIEPLDNYDKCFSNSSFSDYSFILNYETFGELRSSDYIRMDIFYPEEQPFGETKNIFLNGGILDRT